ncbi:MAG: outer membrane beta-barrel protein, partial [Candidatus Brocadiales bacterium]
SLWEFTATCNIKLRDKLWIRPEVRYDKITDSPGGVAEGQFDNHDNNTSIATALTYEF